VAIVVLVAALGQPSQETSMSSSNGIVTIPSHHSAEQTVQRLEDILAAKGVKLFAVIDQMVRAGRRDFKCAHASW
jgi:uncharacterized protein (DUF302 family)